MIARGFNTTATGGLAIGLLLACSAPSTALDAAPQTAQDDVVFAGLCGPDVVLAMASQEKQDLPCPANWRCRRRRLPGGTSTPVDLALARTGTKLAVLYADGSHQIVDLSVPGGLKSAATHKVPRQTYPVADGSRRLVLNEDNLETADEGASTIGSDVPPDIAAKLALACPAGAVRWKRFLPQVDPAIYAPVLEFASGETVFPTETSIWTSPPFQSLARGDRKRSRELQAAALDQYLNTSDQDKRERAALYYRVRSHRGSWLLEYWTYYPFDVGHVESHTHDTEHVFIEVDKLGGGVIGVLAAAHSPLTPNNLYSALAPGAEPATLPIFVIVEKGKHALAPDINRDGRFTPGLDVNVFSETSHLWGVRDAIGQSDAHMLSYEASMTLERDLGNAWAIKEFFDYGARPTLRRVQPAYALKPFPAGTCTSDCENVLTQDYANRLLNEHMDAQDPTNIYKPWVFPFRMIRLGWGNIEGGPLVYAAYVNDLSHFPGLMKITKVPLPGRIAFEVMAGSTEILVPQYAGGLLDTVPVLAQTIAQIRFSGQRLYYGVQYEHSVSNLFGYFVGFSRRYDRLPNHEKVFTAFTNFGGVAGALIPADPPRRTYEIGQVGLFFEHPKLRNLTVHVGPVFSFPAATAGVFVRASISVWRTRGRVQFGDASAP